MGPSDAMVIALLGAIVIVPLAGALVASRAARHYREAGALAHDTLTPGRPCRLELPAGGALELMLRFSTARARVTSEPLTAVVEIARAAHDGAAAIQRRVAIGLTASGPRPAGIAFEGTDGTSYAVEKHGRDTMRTKVLARIDAGGPGHVTVDVLSPGVEVGYCAAFVKPAR